MQETVKVYTSTFRNFNIACISLFLLTTLFTVLFFDKLRAIQVVFYFYFLGFAIANIVFHVVAAPLRLAWVRARVFTVFVPFGLLLVFHIVGLIEFLSVLDEFNDVNNNAYPVPEKDATLSSVYVVMTFALYILPSLFQGLSFCAYSKELGLYLDQASITRFQSQY